MYNIDTLYKAQKSVLKFFDDYSTVASESKFKATHGKGLKMLIPKQMFQRLPIVSAQVKAGNASENLLNEIRQITNSLYRAKEFTKNV